MGAVPLRHETVDTCAVPGCEQQISPAGTGRPARYCSDACRARAHRQRRAAAQVPVSVEVDMGSASSRGRRPEQAWLVRIRRGDRAVIVAIGLRRSAAERLAEQLTDLLEEPPHHPTPNL